VGNDDRRYDRQEAVTVIKRSHVGSLIAVVVACLDSPCLAAPNAKGPVQLATGRDILALAEAAASHGDADTAERALRALFADPSPKLRAEARFRLAKLLTSGGRVPEAAVLLRQIVDEHPDAGIVRLELAALLQRLGEEDLALRQLRALSAMNLPTAVANFVDRVAASLNAAKPFGIYAEFALAPDSNINRATSANTLGTIIGDFTIDKSSRARSGVGAALRTIAHARRSLGDRASLVARATADINLYGRTDFNNVLLEGSAGPEFKLGSRRVSLTAGVGRSWYGMEPFSTHARLSASVAQRIGSVTQLRADGALRWSSNELNNLQDGRGSSLRVGIEHALSPRLFLTASVGVDRLKARDGGYSTRTRIVTASVHREIGRMTLSLGAEAARLKADERLMLFPERRKDSFTRFHLGAVFRQLTVKGFAPMVRFSVERNRSTLELQDYNRARTEVGITRSF
jgi:tetratricopeptide (TPR) repeat protein